MNIDYFHSTRCNGTLGDRKMYKFGLWIVHESYIYPIWVGYQSMALSSYTTRSLIYYGTAFVLSSDVNK